MEQTDRRMHKYFAIDKVGKNAWLQPLEELIGRPEFVCNCMKLKKGFTH